MAGGNCPVLSQLVGRFDPPTVFLCCPLQPLLVCLQTRWTSVCLWPGARIWSGHTGAMDTVYHCPGKHPFWAGIWCQAVRGGAGGLCPLRGPKCECLDCKPAWAFLAGFCIHPEPHWDQSLFFQGINCFSNVPSHSVPLITKPTPFLVSPYFFKVWRHSCSTLDGFFCCWAKSSSSWGKEFFLQSWMALGFFKQNLSAADAFWGGGVIRSNFFGIWKG